MTLAEDSRFSGLDPAAYALPDEVVRSTQTPALVVHLDRVRENVRRVIELAGTPDRWRPHVKTTKIPRVWAELARAGVRAFKCATTREARHLLAVLRDEGVEGGDLLLAHPLVRPSLDELGALAAAHPETRVSVLCEERGAVEEVPASVSVFADVNPGMNRTGIPAADRSSLRALARAAGPRFRGVHWYDGHLHEGEPAERRRAAHASYDELGEVVRSLQNVGVEVGEVITSGTPTFLHALAYERFPEEALHRISPGTVVYHDLRSERENPDLDLVPAAVVLARVVSHPATDVVTCDAGSKSIAAEAGDPCAFVLGSPELVPLPPSEEHLPLRVTSGPPPPRGRLLTLVPRHVCPTVNLAEEALLVEDDRVDIVPVSARAHDLAPLLAR